MKRLPLLNSLLITTMYKYYNIYSQITFGQLTGRYGAFLANGDRHLRCEAINKLGCHQTTFSVNHETMIEQSFLQKKKPLSFVLGSPRDSKKDQPHEGVQENLTGVQSFHRFNETNQIAGLGNPNPDEGQSRNPETIGSRTF